MIIILSIYININIKYCINYNDIICMMKNMCHTSESPLVVISWLHLFHPTAILQTAKVFFFPKGNLQLLQLYVTIEIKRLHTKYIWKYMLLSHEILKQPWNMAILWQKKIDNLTAILDKSFRHIAINTESLDH